MSAEFKFRVRDPFAALEGNVDAQVLGELLVSAAVGGWITARRVRSDVFLHPRRLPRSRRLLRGSSLFLLRLIVIGHLISSFWSPTSIATVRALQLAVVVELGIEACLVCRRNEQALLALRKAVVVGLALSTVVAAALTFLLPAFDPFLSTFEAVDRFRLLYMHPISTAGLLGVLGVFLASTFIWSRDHVADGRARQARALVTVALLGALAGLLLTRERGSTAASFVALGLLLVLAPDRAWRSRVGLLTAGVGFVVVTAFRSVLDVLITRGQDSSTIASFSGRQLIFEKAYEIFVDHPLTGLGYLAGRSVFLPTIPWAGQSHNALVEIAVASGLLGLVAYAVLFSRWFRLVRRGLALRGIARMCAAESVGLVALVTVSGVSDDSFAGPPRLPVVILVLALVFAEVTAGLDVKTSHPSRPWTQDANAGLESPTGAEQMRSSGRFPPSTSPASALDSQV